MSTLVYAAAPAGFKPMPAATFINANGTAAKIVVDQLPPAIETSTSPQFYGGGTVIDMIATSTDTTARDVIIWEGEVTTTVGADTGAVTTTTSSIPRISGSFISDGWLVGDLVMAFSPIGTAPNAGVDGIVCIVTSVGALGLGLNGTPIAALTIATGTRLCRMKQAFRAAVPINAGNTNATPNVKLLGNASVDSTAVTTENKLGLNSIIAASLPVAVTAGAYFLSINAKVALY